MFGAGELPVYPVHRSAKASASEMGAVLTVCLGVLFFAAILAFAIALTTGMTHVAMIIALFATAFFARVGCLKRQ